MHDTVATYQWPRFKRMGTKPLPDTSLETIPDTSEDNNFV